MWERFNRSVMKTRQNWFANEDVYNYGKQVKKVIYIQFFPSVFGLYLGNLIKNIMEKCIQDKVKLWKSSYFSEFCSFHLYSYPQGLRAVLSDTNFPGKQMWFSEIHHFKFVARNASNFILKQTLICYFCFLDHQLIETTDQNESR